MGGLDVAIENLGLRREVVVATDVARCASRLALNDLGAEATVKSGRDVVTSVDLTVEDLITGQLSEAFDYPVIGEERGGDRPTDDRPHWLVDPVCGTRNYASGIPLYCVNIALVVGDEVVGAAVADGSTGEVVVAERGRGAWIIVDDHRARRAVASDQSRTIVVEDGKSADSQRDHAAAVAAAVIRADRWDFRSFGTTLSFSYLATGRLAAYLVFSNALATSPPVHSAAGSLLVREAGGLLSDAAGNAWTLGSPSFIAAATPVLHEELCRLVETNRPEGR